MSDYHVVDSITGIAIVTNQKSLAKALDSADTINQTNPGSDTQVVTESSEHDSDDIVYFYGS